MSNLLDKLNVLVRSSLNNFLGDMPTLDRGEKSSLPKIAPERLGEDIDKEIAALRQRIDQALTEEDAMQARLDQLRQQIDTADQQADAALQRGDEPNARYLIQQMQRQQQLASMMQAELEQHRQATSEFIQRVNMLDAIVSDARREQQAQQPQQIQQAQPQSSTSPANIQTEQTPGAVLSNLLREARERVESALASGEPAQRIPITIEAAETPGTPDKTTSDPQVEDDLAKRRSRLSKPDSAPDNQSAKKPG